MTLPSLRPSIAAGGLLVALYTLSDFGAVSLMQYDALTRVIYLQYRALFDRTPAAVLSLVLVALTALVLVLEARSRRGRCYRTSGPAPQARSHRSALGALALARHLLLRRCVVGLFLAVPLAVLVYWSSARTRSARPRRRVAARPQLGAGRGSRPRPPRPSRPSPSRCSARGTRALDATRSSGSPSRRTRCPAIVIALALVFFGARYAGSLYQTLGLLVFAYVVRFLPEALAGVELGAARRSDPRSRRLPAGSGGAGSGVLAP